MKDVKLIYFEGCPETENLKRALQQAGIFEFEVILQDKLPQDHEYRKFSSPSVIKKGELIYGMRTSDDRSSCTFDTINFQDHDQLVARFKLLKSW